MILIKLTRGYAAIVDDVDSYLCDQKWQALSVRYKGRITNVYANCRKYGLMHRLINKTQKNMQTDHIDGNTLNNCRDNLRDCTVGENQHNSRSKRGSSSKYKGVYWDKERGKWRARITSYGKTKTIGRFDTEKEAKQAYDIESRKLHGEFYRF